MRPSQVTGVSPHVGLHRVIPIFSLYTIIYYNDKVLVFDRWRIKRAKYGRDVNTPAITSVDLVYQVAESHTHGPILLSELY